MSRRVMISIVLTVWVTTIGLLFLLKDFRPKQEQPSQAVEEVSNEAEETQQPTAPIKQTITIGMVGDILLHKPMYNYPSWDFAFKAVKEPMESIDFLLANQESMPGGKELGLHTYPKFNSPKEILGTLKNHGVDFVTIANNHTVDHGEQQVYNTIRHLRAYELPYTGAYDSPEDAANLRVQNVQGVQVGVLAYTYGTNIYGKEAPAGKSYLVNLIDEQKILADIEAIRAVADVVVLSLHWGDEYQNAENAWQRDLATTFTAAGADIIFGHHPHVVQPFEEVNGKPVFYSIGNFYSGMPWANTNIGGIARVQLTKTTQDGVSTIAIDANHFYPTAVLRDVPLAGIEKNAFRIVPLQEIGSSMGHSVEWVENLVGLPSWE